MNLEVPLKWSKSVLMGKKSLLSLIKHTFRYICARSGPLQLGVLLVFAFFNLVNNAYKNRAATSIFISNKTAVPNFIWSDLPGGGGKFVIRRTPCVLLIRL